MRMSLNTSIEKIEAFFDQIKPVKEELNEINRDINRIFNVQVNENMNGITSSWKEEAADDFLRMEDLIKEKIINESKVIDIILDDIGNMSDMLYRIESCNSSLKSSRRF